ncbi:inosine guanosine and [Ceraceosorus guamensis]|uniref:purine-nucleoside phosphorylase n=1 Tax=Ceraceosorus guamensis TaxID=1522189 RepID=A0A316W232_9BASI|nr:inosine guanosine and [Ceraceosorus guamensis]PWN43584.1 inosine guanosine and [Ceraceosorus guamensis]
MSGIQDDLLNGSGNGTSTRNGAKGNGHRNGHGNGNGNANRPETPLARLQESHRAIISRLPNELCQPTWGIICGSGLGGLADHLEERVDVQYADIPHMPRSTVQGHKSAFAFGFLSKSSSAAFSAEEKAQNGTTSRRIPVVAALGRFHLYEGYDAQDAAMLVRLFKLLGASSVVVTNASGGLHPDWDVGTIMAMHDHLSLPTLSSMNPLIGENFELGSRFIAMSDAYDPALRLALYRSAASLGTETLSLLRSGTYAYVAGPTYESRAESRFLRSAGADCVGMSTVPEVISARHLGLRILGISLVTNKVVVTPYFDADAAVRQELKTGKTFDAEAIRKQDAGEAANHEEVLEVGRRRADDVRKLVERTILTADA